MDSLSKLIGIKIEDYVCISLKSEKERRIETLKECKKLGFEPKFRIVEKHNNPVQGCLESHLYCIQWAKNNNLKNVLILEDDVKFDIEKIKNINKINIPPKWEMLYFGYNCNHGGKVSSNLLKLDSGFTTHCYLVNSSIYDYILNNINSEWDKSTIGFETEKSVQLKAIDVFYAKMIHQKRGNTYGVYPLVAYQRPEFSMIENKMVDYSEVFDKKASIVSKLFKSKYITNDYSDSEYDYRSNIELVPEYINKISKVNKYNWDICYLNEDKTKKLYRNTKNNNEVYLYPSIDYQYSFTEYKNFIPIKPILCIIGDNISCDLLEFLKHNTYMYIFVVCDKEFVDDNIQYITKEQYKYIPKHHLILFNSLNYFIDYYHKDVEKIFLWINDENFLNFKWNDIKLKNNNKPLLFNFKHRLNKIIMSKYIKEIYDIVDTNCIIIKDIPSHLLTKTNTNNKKNTVFVEINKDYDFDEFYKFYEKVDKNFKFLLYSKDYDFNNSVDNIIPVKEKPDDYEYYFETSYDCLDECVAHNSIYISNKRNKSFVVKNPDDLNKLLNDDKRLKLYYKLSNDYFQDKCGLWFKQLFM